MSVCVCLLVHGDRAYFTAAAVAVRSVLEHSGFDVFVGFDGDDGAIPDHRRVTRRAISGRFDMSGRPYRFLAKFLALRACLAQGTHDHIILMDADIVLARRLTERGILVHLRGASLGMIEQTTVTGSTMDRAAFLEHFERYAAPVILNRPSGLTVDEFRYFNSGVVVAHRSAWERLVPWAIDHAERSQGAHEIGEHMVADQDYFQVWANIVEPDACTVLPWYWNHCEYWHDNFPRLGVLFAHFSNFCLGPRQDTCARMRALMRGHRVLMNGVAGRLTEARWIRTQA